MNQMELDLQPSNEEYRIIPLTRGQVAIVDAEDFERLSKRKWCAMWNSWGKAFYATSHSGGRLIHMSREVLGVDCFVDHRDRNTLDNRKKNLRPATRAQNAWNRGKLSTNRSGFKGVHWDKNGRCWRAKIEANGVRHKLGKFPTAQAAHEAYKAAALELHGEFARVD